MFARFFKLRHSVRPDFVDARPTDRVLSAQLFDLPMETIGQDIESESAGWTRENYRRGTPGLSSGEIPLV